MTTLEQVIEERARAYQSEEIRYKIVRSGDVYEVWQDNISVVRTGALYDCAVWVHNTAMRATIEADCALGLALVPEEATEGMRDAAIENDEVSVDRSALGNSINAAVRAGNLLKGQDDG